MYRKMFSVFSLILILAVALSAVSPAYAQPSLKSQGGKVGESPNGVYIVQMIHAPVIAYKGDVKGYNSTKPLQGEKVDTANPDVAKYVAHLEDEHNAALSQAGGDKLYDYTYSFNGFAAQMTVDQANELAAVDGVMLVSPDAVFTVDTSSTTSFLGLDAKGGLWDQLGGFDNAGEGVVIGIIDSGIWPESLSFADSINEDTKQWTFATGDHVENVYKKPKKWNAACDFTDASCNNKLIGAQHFNASFGGDAGIAATRPWEFLSARDYNAHGTHTSSTAGGNHGVVATGPAAVFGSISGMAPHAYISMYKALWSTQSGDTASGSTSDLVAAIDQAVADGVDVINYSISGSSTDFLDPAEIAFLNAADAGVFVAASAGNSGPTPSTVAHPSPWITTVAAGTHNRGSSGSVTLGNAVTYNGASLAATAVTAPLINSSDAGLSGADATQVALCYSSADGGNVLDPAKVAGKIVVCDRGVTARVNKSLAVQEAGGVGMILLNPSANSLNADFHYLPTVHLQNTDAAAVHAYAATAGATATINAAVLTFTDPAPFTASFSSRGPLRAGGGDLLKPDLIAPGQDILAAVSPAIAGRDFDLLSGTSMSSPHVAGLAALLKDLHPKWSPMMIKSALMTTGYDVLDGPATNPSVIFSQGAGHVRPNNAADPGLVYDSSYNDWLAFLCGATSGVNPAYCSSLAGAGYSLDPSDLNLASIAIGDMAGSQTVRRTVSNVGKKETYTFSYTGLAGMTVVPSVNSFTIEGNKSKTYTVKFTNTGAALNTYVGGYITWTGNKGHVVRMPVVIRPVALAAPAAVSGNGGPLSYNVKFGFAGPFTTTTRGLVPAQTLTDQVIDGQYQDAPDCQVVTVPAGTTYARFSLFNSTTTPNSDLDLEVYNSAWGFVGGSGGGTSDEEFNLVNPAAGIYHSCVFGYATANPSVFTQFAWAVGSTAAGNMTVSAPATATLGAVSPINLTFSGLAPATKYLGIVSYSSGGSTFVRVDTP
ncbi:MAG: S8 family peptidase [Chloroflexota bacterium]